jgi:hypothetical protein
MHRIDKITLGGFGLFRLIRFVLFLKFLLFFGVGFEEKTGNLMIGTADAIE